MSYSVHIVRRETESNCKAAGDPAFFESDSSYVAFSDSNIERLTTVLEIAGWEERPEADGARFFTNENIPGARALLTTGGLFLNASGEEGIFEILQFASETADDELAKYDPQEDSWE